MPRFAPHASRSATMLERQSTTVPNTSKTSALRPAGGAGISVLLRRQPRMAARPCAIEARREMDRVRLAAVSRNYFNLPLWVALHEGMWRKEGIEVALELHEPIDEVTQRLQDGRVELACGVTEHVIVDAERGGDLRIVGGNVNKLPFTLIGGRDVKGIADLRGRTVGVSSIEAGSSSLVMQLLAEQGLRYPGD